MPQRLPVYICHRENVTLHYISSSFYQYSNGERNVFFVYILQLDRKQYVVAIIPQALFNYNTVNFDDGQGFTIHTHVFNSELFRHKGIVTGSADWMRL